MKIGFLSMPLTGHLNPMTALARKLQSRGHEVVFIGVPDIEPAVRAANLDFVPFCKNEYPPGSVPKKWGGVANLHGLDVARYTAWELTPGLVKAALEHLPEKITETGVNALVLDTIYRLLEIVPMHLGLPEKCVRHHSRSGERISGDASGPFGRYELQPGLSRTNPSKYNCRSDRSTNGTTEARGALYNSCRAKYSSGGVGAGSADGCDTNRL